MKKCCRTFQRLHDGTIELFGCENALLSTQDEGKGPPMLFRDHQDCFLGFNIGSITWISTGQVTPAQNHEGQTPVQQRHGAVATSTQISKDGAAQSFKQVTQAEAHSEGKGTKGSLHQNNNQLPRSPLTLDQQRHRHINLTHESCCMGYTQHINGSMLPQSVQKAGVQSQFAQKAEYTVKEDYPQVL